MPTLLSLLGTSYQYDGFGIDQMTDERPLVFYSADNQIVARSHNLCYIYEPKTDHSFYYRTTPQWGLKETKPSKEFEPLRRYVFSMIQTAQYILKRQY